MVVEQNPLFIITTFVFGGLFFVTLFALVAVWFFMKPEGRYFLRRSFSGGSLDSIRHEPLSNQLILDTLKWNGETFHNDVGIYYPLSQILNPKTAAQNIYNKIVSNAARWKGSKRPVIFTTDLMSFAVPVGFYAAIAKAKNAGKYKKILPFLTQLETFLKENNVNYFSFIESFSIGDIQEIIKDVGPRKIRDSYRKGVNAEKLKNTKIGDNPFGQIPLWAIMLVLVAVVGGILYFVTQSGYISI